MLHEPSQSIAWLPVTDPVLIAFSARRSRDKKRTFWTRIGQAYPHDQGAGLTVILDVLPPDGRIILLEPDDADDRRLEREAKRFQKKEVLTRSRAYPLLRRSRLVMFFIKSNAFGYVSPRKAGKLKMSLVTTCCRTIWANGSPRRQPRRYGAQIDQRIRDILATSPPDGRRCWTATLISNQIDGVTYQYIWEFLRKQRINLRAGRIARQCQTGSISHKPSESV
jgi:hypothetical protein